MAALEALCAALRALTEAPARAGGAGLGNVAEALQDAYRPAAGGADDRDLEQAGALEVELGPLDLPQDVVELDVGPVQSARDLPARGLPASASASRRGAAREGVSANGAIEPAQMPPVEVGLELDADRVGD